QRNAAHVVARERTGKIGVAPRRARQAPTRRVCGGLGRRLRKRDRRRGCDNTQSKQRWEDDGGRPFHSDPSRDRMAKYTPSVMIVYKTTSASGVRMGCRSIRLLPSVAVALSSLGFTSSASAQAQPELIESRPNLNGVWQALGTAHWNLEGHSAEALPEFWRLGAIGAIAAGRSVVVGGKIPYL